MKQVFLSRWTVAVFSATLLSGCSKTEESSAPAVTQTAPPPAAPVAETIKAAEEKPQVPPPVVVSTPAVPSAPPTPVIPDTAAAAQTETQNLFARIRGLIAEQKYPEALAALSEVSTSSLTADQKTLFEQLKAQAQNALTKQTADQGLKGVGNLLKK